LFEWLRSKTSADADSEGPSVRALREALHALARVQVRADAANAALRELKSELDLLRAESGETAESLRKLARSFGRTALRVEEIERKVDAAANAGPCAQVPAERDLAGLFDAIDLLDRARESIDLSASPELAIGLDGIHTRLVRHLTAEGFERIAPRGAEPDGMLVRVVGTVDHPATAPGRVVSVVRAAIKHGDRIIREGEVITARPLSPSPEEAT